MLRVIAQWWISSAIDQDRPLPGWLRRWVQRDPELMQYELMMRQLGDRLKGEAADWVSRPSLPASMTVPESAERADRRPMLVPQRDSRPKKQRVVWTVGAVVSAACLFYIALRTTSIKDAVPPPVSDGNPQLAQTPRGRILTDTEREKLVRLWKVSRIDISELQRRARELPGQTQDWKLPPASVMIQPVNVAGAKLGHALVTLEQGMETEQKRLTSELKSAASFFTYRLPASVGKLVKLPPSA